MGRTKKVVEKEVRVETPPVEITDPTLVAAKEKLADIETIFSLMVKWDVKRFSTVVNLRGQLTAEVARLESI